MAFHSSNMAWLWLYAVCITQLAAGGTVPEPLHSDSDTLQHRPGMLVYMVADPSVQADLGLSTGTKEEIEGLNQELRTASRNCNCGSNNQNADDRKAQYEAFLEKAKKLDAKARSEFSNEDLTRLRQIVWQEAGPFGLAKFDDLTGALGLNDRKRSHIKAIVKNFNEQGKEVMYPRDGSRFDPKILTAMREEADARILGLLSDEERSRYKQLLGKPFQRLSKTKTK